MEFEYKYARPAPALNPGHPPHMHAHPQPQPQQQHYQVPPQHPVAVGAEANTTGSKGGERWKTAALWIAGVIASTTIAYFVTKGLRANDERRARNKADRDDTPDSGPRFVLPNDGAVDQKVVELGKGQSRLVERLQDVEHWITTQEKRGALRDKQ